MNLPRENPISQIEEIVQTIISFEGFMNWRVLGAKVLNA